ncbi:MAG: SDR family NAD(P)-dependent oxidoreductase [Saprospiraceae bacterium]|nr:SDR family NAD(P)-dependent oxidoreductase [Saprospiraceae bacterium]
MKSIIVTGASGNMGQAVVERFAEDGQKVYAVLGLGENSRMFSESPLSQNIDVQFLNLTDETVSEGYVKGIVAKDPAVEAALCIVGGWQPGTLAETTGYELDKMLKLNFSTAFNIAKPLMEYFERRGGGQFIFIGARPAINPAEAKNQVAYALSKSLVFRLAEIINDQGKFKNIRSSVIIPSILDTPQNRAAMPDADMSDWVTPESAADTIAFLLSDTGSTMRETVIKLYNQA